MVLGVSEGPEAVRTQKEGGGEKCPLDFLRRKILPGYNKLPKVEGENPLMWDGERFKHHLDEAIHCLLAYIRCEKIYMYFFSFHFPKTTPFYGWI